MDQFPLVTNSYHYIKMIQCSFRLGLGGLESGVRAWGWCREEDLSGPEPEENSLISAQLLSSLASGKVA
jgi:hypothetical protein